MKATVKIILMIVGVIVLMNVNAFASNSVVIDGVLEWLNWDNIGLFVENGHASGGQRYDVEILALMNRGNRLYFGLQTGYPVYRRGAGDFALSFDEDSYFEYALDVRWPSRCSRDPFFNLVEVSSWRTPQVFPENNPYAYNTGSIIGSFDSIAYSYYYDCEGKHNILEGCIDASAFDIDWFRCVDMHWTMYCGNDVGDTRDCPPETPVPEPCTLILIGLGSVAYIFKKNVLK